MKSLEEALALLYSTPRLRSISRPQWFFAVAYVFVRQPASSMLLFHALVLDTCLRPWRDNILEFPYWPYYLDQATNILPFLGSPNRITAPFPLAVCISERFVSAAISAARKKVLLLATWEQASINRLPS